MASGLITEYLGEGLTAARPATPDIPSGAIALYYSTDDNEMSAYADGAWIEDVFGTGGALLVANNLSDLASASTARTNLGLAIGTDVQAYDADLADIAGLADAQGDIIIRGASGWERLAAGTDGQVLTTGGAGANPAWEDAAGGGGPTVIASLSSPTSGAFVFTSLSLGAYDRVVVEMRDFVPSANSTSPVVTLYFSGVEVTSNYFWQVSSVASSGAGNNDGLTTGTSIMLTSSTSGNWQVQTGTGNHYSGDFTLIKPASTLHKQYDFVGRHTQGGSGHSVTSRGGGKLANTGTPDGIKIAGTNNWSSGTVRILGYT